MEIKQPMVVSRSTIEADYKAMATTTWEVTWLLPLLKDLNLPGLKPATLKCGNQATLYIVVNSIFYEKTKHVEVHYPYVRDNMKVDLVKPTYVHTKA